MPDSFSFRQLLTFKTLMEVSTMSEAARTLGRSQPAVSAAIAGLEQDLGVSLFDRRKGRLVPRPEARYFLEEVEAILERAARSARVMREIGDLRRGVLRVASMPSAGTFFVPELMAEFLSHRPDVTASMMMRSSIVVEDWVASQQYDIGLAETPAPRTSIMMRVHELECVCAVPAEDPLARLDVVTPRELDGRPMAALYPQHVTNRDTVAAFERCGRVFRHAYEFQTFLPSVEIVTRGLGCVVCDPITAATYAARVSGGHRVAFRPFAPAVPYSVAILTPAHRPVSALARAFQDLLEDRLTDLAARARPDGVSAMPLRPLTGL